MDTDDFYLSLKNLKSRDHGKTGEGDLETFTLDMPDLNIKNTPFFSLFSAKLLTSLHCAQDVYIMRTT